MIILSAFVVAGIVIGIIVVFDPFLTHQRITRGLLDGNVLNVASPGQGFFNFVFARLLDMGLGLLLISLFNLTKWTWWLTFVYLGFRSFWMVVNLWWIIDRFGFFHGAPFFIVYLVFLLAIMFVLIFVSVLIMKRGKVIRSFGFRAGCRMREIKKPMFIMICIILAIGLIEWFMYFALLQRLIYMF